MCLFIYISKDFTMNNIRKAELKGSVNLCGF